DLFLVKRITFRLIQRPFVPLKIEPVHCVQDRLNCLRCRSFTVGVFDSENDLASIVTRKEVVKEGGSGAAYMRRGGWPRSNTRVNVGHISCKVTRSRSGVNDRSLECLFPRIGSIMTNSGGAVNL